MIVCLFLLIAVPTVSTAGETAKRRDAMPSKIGWSMSTRGGYVHQMDSDIDDGGSFSVNRFFVQGGPTYVSEESTSIGLAVGYGLDSYDFSGNTGFGGRNPWDDIHSLRLSMPLRWKMGEQWTGFISPTLRYTGEEGADFDDALTGGGFAGVSYRLGDSLTIGPGVGFLTQLEDSSQVIPVLIINWKITDTLSLNTGRGIGSTLGPGLFLGWKPSRSLSFSIGGRYERLRFRLDDKGAVSDGIGEDRSFSILGGVEYKFTPKVRIAVLGGVNVGGELRLEDEKGHEITEDNHDPAGFLGIAFRARF
jgi:hypothetical protein